MSSVIFTAGCDNPSWHRRAKNGRRGFGHIVRGSPKLPKLYTWHLRRGEAVPGRPEPFYPWNCKSGSSWQSACSGGESWCWNCLPY